MISGSKIREYFIYKQLARNNRYKLLPKFDIPKVWEDIAEICNELNVSYTYYIDCIFEMLNSAKYTIFPKTLLNPKFKRNVINKQTEFGKNIFKDINEYIKEEYDKSLFTIREFLRTHPGETFLTVVRMQGFMIPAWLRMSLAPDDPIIKAKYLEKAKEDVNNIIGLKEALKNGDQTFIDSKWIAQ